MGRRENPLVDEQVQVHLDQVGEEDRELSCDATRSEKNTIFLRETVGSTHYVVWVDLW
jgi:hypothetical protein